MLGYKYYTMTNPWQGGLTTAMLIFGHSGITLGIAVLLNSAVNKGGAPTVRENKLSKRDEHSAEVLTTRDCPSRIRPLSFTSLGTRLDIRLLLIGSLLPDIIDKPLGQFFFRETFNNGRIFSHTLLFLILITLVGYYLYHNYRKTWLLALALGTFAHLIEDRMWLAPKTLLWPLYGFAFEKINLENWIGNILHALLTDPGVYIPETIGMLILAAFMTMLVRRKKVFSFIGSGRVC